VPRAQRQLAFLCLTFFVSGIPALLYQIVWQRALYAVYGVTTDSVTVIVAAFLLGLGIGSYLGGKLSSSSRIPHLLVFCVAELTIALFGLMSLRLIDAVATRIPSANTLTTGLIAFLIVLLPTTLMGATLPILVQYAMRRWTNVGRSVGLLYFVNTLGSAAACFIAALITMPRLGMSGTVAAAAALNVIAGSSAFALYLHDRRRTSPVTEEQAARPSDQLIPFRVAILLSAVAGFIAIAYEILWFRAFHFVTGGTARSFSFLLGAYLAGIAFGSLFARRLCSGATDRIIRDIALCIAAANLIGFITVPALARMLHWLPYGFALPMICISAAAMGAVFPLICHVAVDREHAGSGLSKLYLSNIMGSTLGSIAIGYFALDLLPSYRIEELLSIAGVCIAALVYLSGSGARLMPAAIAAAVIAAIAISAAPVSNGLYESMLRKRDYDPRERFTNVVETRSGVVAVDAKQTIYGDGAYDGYIDTDVTTTDSVLRPFSLSYFHPNPEEVLVIGVSGGAWSEVIANHPQVKSMTLVEINPGYVDIIGRYPEVSPILTNPKVTFVVDDGRRWLRRNPERKFDVILMDTTYHWRAHATNLLSTEFLQMARRHLKPGGILFYNTTHSMEAQHTGASTFPHAYRFGPFLAVSDSPLQLDKNRWHDTLVRYALEGEPVFDMNDPEDRDRLSEILAYADKVDAVPYDRWGMETGDSIRRRTAGLRMITDDNMASEWSR
jgi:predicted membrane-bound spermidine synthase